MSSFQHRLSSGRDIFESTFDELILIGRLNTAQAWSIVGKRLREEEQEARLEKETGGQTGPLWDEPQQARMQHNASVLALFAGGIPRELMRNLREVLLEFNQLYEPSPSEIGIFLLLRKLDEIIESISQVAITGDESVHLYNSLLKVKAHLGETSIHTATIRRTTLDCIDIIDPWGLHKSVTPTSEADRKDQYQAIRHDLQHLVELLIMTDILAHLLQAKAQGATQAEQPLDTALEARVFSCFESLDQNPALALHILQSEPAEQN